MRGGASPGARLPWCFSTLGCSELSLDQALALADRFSIPFVEIRFLENQDDLPGYLARHFPSGWESLASRRRATPLILGTSLRLVGHETLPGLHAFLPWAGAVKWIRVFDGGQSGRPLSSAERERCRRCLAWCRALLAEAGLSTRIVVETHDALSHVDECLRLVEATAGEIDLLWDSHHTWRAGSPPLDAWRSLKPWIRHIHVKDSRTVPDGFAYVLPGTGEFDLPGLLSRLRIDGYPGAVSLEWERRWHPALPSLEQALSSLSALTAAPSRF